jgi:hypothetical protein
MEYMSDIKIIDYTGELSMRSTNALLDIGCVTMRDVAKLSESFIKTRIPNIGKLSSKEILYFREIMASLCYLTVENHNAHEIAVYDNMGGKIVISDYEQVAQLCVDLMKIRDQKWVVPSDGDDEGDDEDGAIDIMVDPGDCFLKLEQDFNVISFANKEQAKSIAEALLMLVQEKDDE